MGYLILNNFSYGLALLRALGVPVLMFILCHAAKNEPRKRARTFPPGPPFDCRSSNLTEEKDMFDPMHLSPHSYHERQAEKARSFLLKY